MKKFILIIFKNLLWLFVSIILVCEINIPDDKISKLVPEDYAKVSWNINLITNNSDLIKGSSVFIGSSLIEHGISDSLLCARGLKSINMGVSRAGFDLDYYFVSRILAYQPKEIYLIRMPNGSSPSHPVTPLLISPLAHLLTFRQLNFNFLFDYIPKRLYFVLNSFLILNSTKCSTLNLFGQTYYRNKYLNLNKESQIEFEKESSRKFDKLKLESIDKNGVHVSKSIFQNIWRYFLAYFINGNGEKIRAKTISLSNINNVKTVEIYIPSYGDVCFNQSNCLNGVNFVKNKIVNCIFIKDLEFLNRKLNWRDVSHLSYEGALRFTDSLSKKMK
jgi:hypothetical protein